MPEGSDLMTPHSGLQEVSPVGLVIREGISRDDWRDIGSRLGRMNGAMRWFVGDWLNYGEAKWGEMYDEAERLSGYTKQTLQNCKWIAGRFQLSSREDKLTFAHHLVVAPLSDADADRWLRIAVDRRLSRDELRAAVNEERGLPASTNSGGDELEDNAINGGLRRLMRAKPREVIEKTFITIKVLGSIFASIKTRPENTEQIINQLLEVEKKLRHEIVRLKEMAV